MRASAFALLAALLLLPLVPAARADLVPPPGLFPCSFQDPVLGEVYVACTVRDAADAERWCVVGLKAGDQIMCVGPVI